MLNSPYILQYQFDRIFPDTITLQLEENFKFNYPAHITIDKKERFFIVDRENSDILIADFKGFIVKVIQDKLRNPNGIYISANNDIYVSDKGVDPIFVFDSNGEYLRNLSRPEPITSKKLISTAGLAIDQQGWLYTIDATNYKLNCIDPTGLNKIEWAPEIGPFFPIDVAIDRFNNIYLLESGFARIRILLRNGQ